MKKILFSSNIPTPYVTEFIDAINNSLEGVAKVTIVFESKNKSFRSHWKSVNNGIILNSKNKNKHFKKILNELNPDVLVLTLYNTWTTINGVNWAKKMNKPFIFGPHEILSPHRTSYIKRYLKFKLYQWVTKNAKGVATMGNESIRDVAKFYKGPIVHIPYSFDLSRLLAMNPPPLEEKPLIFLYSGRLYDFRNPLLSIRVFAKARKANPTKKIKFIISGTGPLEVKCKELIRDLDIEQDVEWMNNFKDWYDIHTLYSHAHVLLALQYFGTWGIIIQEAMAAGLGVISTNTIQSADNMIIDNYNGFLTTLNEDQIVEKMQYYIDNPHMVMEHGKRSKEIVKIIDVNEIGNKFANLIKSQL